MCERLYTGGGFTLAIGTYTNIEVEPLFGYRITPRLSAGILVKYGFYKKIKKCGQCNRLKGHYFVRHKGGNYIK